MIRFLLDLPRCWLSARYGFEDARMAMTAASSRGVQSVAESCAVCGFWHVRQR